MKEQNTNKRRKEGRKEGRELLNKGKNERSKQEREGNCSDRN